MSIPTHPIEVRLDELIALRGLGGAAGVARRRRAAAARSGGVLSRWRGRGMDFRESRAYQAGDEIRHMDWRVTARTGRAHTKLFEEEREQGLLLALDLNPGMRFGTRTRFKNVQAARAAALLAWRAAAAGDRIGALAFGGGVEAEARPLAGRRGVLAVLRGLCDWNRRADPTLASPLADGLQRLQRLLRPGMRVVVLSDGLAYDPRADRELARIAARHDTVFVLVEDALELAPPPPGSYAVELSARRGWFDLRDTRMREAWTEGFAATRARLRAACARTGIPVLELATDADLVPALAGLLGRRGRGGAA